MLASRPRGPGFNFWSDRTLYHHMRDEGAKQCMNCAIIALCLLCIALIALVYISALSVVRVEINIYSCKYICCYILYI